MGNVSLKVLEKSLNFLFKKGERTLYCYWDTFLEIWFQRDLDFNISVDFSGELCNYQSTANYRMR